MATVHYRIRSKANKNVSISISLSQGRGKVIEKNTGFNVNPSDWSDKTGLPKQTTAHNKQLSNNLKKLDQFINSKLNQDQGNGILVDSYWLQNAIKNCFDRVEKVDTGLLSNHIQYIIDNASTRKVKGRNQLGISISRVKSYGTFKTIIQEYQTTTKKKPQLFRH